MELKDPLQPQEEDELLQAVGGLAINQMDDNNNNDEGNDEAEVSVQLMQFDDSTLTDCVETSADDDEVRKLCAYSLSDEEDEDSDNGFKKKMLEGKD